MPNIVGSFADLKQRMLLHVHCVCISCELVRVVLSAHLLRCLQCAVGQWACWNVLQFMLHMLE